MELCMLFMSQDDDVYSHGGKGGLNAKEKQRS